MAVLNLKAAKAAALGQIEYCHHYHCSGDCGQPHNSAEFRESARHVLGAFDAMEHEDKRARKETAADVHRKARNML